MLLSGSVDKTVSAAQLKSTVFFSYPAWEMLYFSSDLDTMV